MTKTTIKAPTKIEKRVMRVLIILGLVSIGNFFYWFFKDDLKSNSFLYGMLLALIIFDIFRLIYIWYHYWSITIPKKPENFRKYNVDVFTTFCHGEPEDMVINTLKAIQNISYPHTTYLCDEDDNQRLKSFCHDNNIIHITRHNRKDAKAGNINNALKIAKGEICLILDPDHIPDPDFLDEVIPYFEDDTIGFVQTVQSYYNINESKVAQAAAEQTFQFYGPVMMSMNTYGTVNAIGANCVFRRKALDSIDGHAAGLSEDMHTAMKLHGKGWKSIYVPKALSAGLAPQTLSAYYKQQLKWSRGTFDLLFTAYPKLFKSFSLKQKLHYGILPFHYLAGLFFMFSFLIPIISLLFSTTPWKGNVINFGLIALPVLVSLITIRFYSQRWLIRKEERGFHILGGLLLQCTWWVYLNGVLFTLIRKNVPYLPTLKDDEDANNFSIVLPNIIIGFLCLFSVFYGLIQDFTPFSIVMSVFAIWNACILFYTIKFANGQKATDKSESLKTEESFFRHLSIKAFKFGNKIALPLVIVVLICSIVFLINNEKVRQEGYFVQSSYTKKIKYLGVFAPKEDNGISDLRKVSQISYNLSQKFDIISYYIPWNKDIENGFNWNLLDSVYQNNSMPLITWEPWLNTFEIAQDSVPHVNDLILEGSLDGYLNEFALKLKKINRPIFLRFSHEFDNPFYPWYDKRENAASKFKKAWKYVHTIFRKRGVTNVIWVWNPWKAEHIKEFFPGEDYVDWLGANILNYATFGENDYFEFKKLYESFHNEFKKLPNKPVIITELGTLQDSVHQYQWIVNAFKAMNGRFKEVDAIVYFNSHVDNNYPEGLENEGYLNWSINSQKPFVLKFKSQSTPKYLFGQLPNVKTTFKDSFNITNKLKNIKGVNFIKGKKWYEDYHVLSKENLDADFENMKAIGINAITFKDNTVYNHNVLKLTKDHGINIDFAFEIPLNLDFQTDSNECEQFKEYILESVERYKDQTHIISWHIQNDKLSNQQKEYHKPERIFQQDAYLLWLEDLLQGISKIDSRPIVVDLEVNKHAVAHAKMMMSFIKQNIVFGLIVKQPEYIHEVKDYFKRVNKGFLYSIVDLKMAEAFSLLDKGSSFYLPAWQDQYKLNYLSFNGLIDRKGFKKGDYFKAGNLINKDILDEEKLRVKILKRLNITWSGYDEIYYAMVLNEKRQWEFAAESENLIFEWSLLKLDQNGNYIGVKKVGDKPILHLIVPQNHHTYNLELSVSQGKMSYNHITTLNTPYDLE